MIKNSWLVPALCTLITVSGSPLPAQAQTADLFVDINGTLLNNVANADGANTNRVVLCAGGSTCSYGAIQISSMSSSAPAMVERYSDDVIDYIALHNTTVKPINGTITNFPITFWGTTLAPPSNPPNWYYNLEADGSFESPDGKPKGTVTLKTSIKVSGGAWDNYQSWSKTVNCTFSPCAARIFTGISKQSPNSYGTIGTNPRDLKGELTITLSSTNYTVNFYNGSGVRAKSGAQQDCDWIDTFLNLFRSNTDYCLSE